MDIKYYSQITYNENGYTIILQKYYIEFGEKIVIESKVESDKTLNECINIQNEFIK
jgi:hypothetical protein